MARRRARWPLISEKSGSPAFGCEGAKGSGATAGGAGPPESSWQASPRASIRCTEIPSTRAASSADIPGRSRRRFPILLARRAIARAPRMGRVDPERLSSPAIRQSSAISSCSWWLAAKSARAIGRSYNAPSLRRAPGARLTVVLVLRAAKPQWARAEWTRFADSFTAASGRPSRINLGSPRSFAFTSTCTGTASIPTSAAEVRVASMACYSSRSDLFGFRFYVRTRKSTFALSRYFRDRGLL